VLGGNTVAGLALTFLLKDAGYETIVLKSPPTGPTEDLLRDVDLLVVSPDLDDQRRREGLTALEGTGPRVPVLTLGPGVEDRLFAAEAAGSSWPVEIGGLARAIEAALRDGAQCRPAVAANPTGETALP
jgi:hypothetical protein